MHRSKRLSFPTRWKDLEPVFGIHDFSLRQIFWEVIEKFTQTRPHLLETLRSDLMTERTHAYAAAIHEKGAPSQNCVGFIDCTKVQMNGPEGIALLQCACQSDNKRFHYLIYQSVTTTDGIMFYLNGPEVGVGHDMTLYRQRNLDQQFQFSTHISGQHFGLYSDAAYVLRAWLQVSFIRTSSIAEKTLYNKCMSSVR